MQEALFDKTVVDIGGNEYLFRAEGETQVFDGYLKVFDTSTLEKMAKIVSRSPYRPDYISMNLCSYRIWIPDKILPNQARFMESSLVKNLTGWALAVPVPMPRSFTPSWPGNMWRKKINCGNRNWVKRSIKFWLTIFRIF
jgi:hypothetical protein